MLGLFIGKRHIIPSLFGLHWPYQLKIWRNRYICKGPVCIVMLHDLDKMYYCTWCSLATSNLASQLIYGIGPYHKLCKIPLQKYCCFLGIKITISIWTFNRKTIYSWHTEDLEMNSTISTLHFFHSVFCS